MPHTMLLPPAMAVRMTLARTGALSLLLNQKLLFGLRLVICEAIEVRSCECLRDSIREYLGR